MEEIYFSSVEVNGRQENNQSFFYTEEEAKKVTETKFQEELRIIQKLLSDYNIDTPMINQILRSLKVNIHVKKFTLTKQIAS